MVNLSKWSKDVKKALIDRNMTMRELADKLGYSTTTISCVIGGRYASSSYRKIAESINEELGTEGVPERSSSLYEEWCTSVKVELARRRMTLTEMAERVGVSRDTLSLVVNGRDANAGVVASVSEALGIDVPASDSPDGNMIAEASGE